MAFIFLGIVILLIRIKSLEVHTQIIDKTQHYLQQKPFNGNINEYYSLLAEAKVFDDVIDKNSYIIACA